MGITRTRRTYWADRLTELNLDFREQSAAVRALAPGERRAALAQLSAIYRAQREAALGAISEGIGPSTVARLSGLNYQTLLHYVRHNTVASRSGKRENA